MLYLYPCFDSGANCGYHHQWGQDKVNAAVEVVVYKLVNNPKFQEALKAKVGAKTDTDELEKEREICRTRLRQTIGAKNKLAEQMDALDVSDKFYGRKYEDMQDRMDELYEEIGAIEDEIDTISMRIDNINKKQLSKTPSIASLRVLIKYIVSSRMQRRSAL